MSYLPWALLFEWLFRLLGVLAFGPHMLWVGRTTRERWAAFCAKSDAFRDGSSAMRREMLDEYRAECTQVIQEMIDREIHGRPPPPEVRKGRGHGHGGVAWAWRHGHGGMGMAARAWRLHPPQHAENCYGWRGSGVHAMPVPACTARDARPPPLNACYLLLSPAISCL